MWRFRPEFRFLGLAYKHQIRYEPGSHAWVWERAWRPGARRFDAGAAGAAGVAIVTTGGGNAPAIIYGSTDGGATWTDGAVLNVSNATSGGPCAASWARLTASWRSARFPPPTAARWRWRA